MGDGADDGDDYMHDAWRSTEQNAADEDDNEDGDGEDGRCDDAKAMRRRWRR